MKLITELSNEEARQHFLKGSSYFNNDMPSYIKFDDILRDLNMVLDGKTYNGFCNDKKPKDFEDVNYSLLSNKDGKFAWRPLELMHPVIYISLLNVICQDSNWQYIVERFSEFKTGLVNCCSIPTLSIDNQSDKATQITNWWQTVEQKSLCYSLEFSHIIHTDVIDCYGSLYTHSIPWAIHGKKNAKQNQKRNDLFGNDIDSHIQASRYGQTNGISQGSVLMDFIAEIVLGFVDLEISKELKESDDFKILRYRDDYRVFTKNDHQAEKILQVISDKLRSVGMKLGASKTFMSKNVIEGSIKPDKLAGIDLQDLGIENAKTIQKQLLRLHTFGQKFPNSGALRRLISEFYEKLSQNKSKIQDDLEVQVAIATDIGVVSPSTFPVVAGILSYLISNAPNDEKKDLWEKVKTKMKRVPYNGYLEIWLQRVTHPIGIKSDSDEAICKIVNGESENAKLWTNAWIKCKKLERSLDVKKIYVGSASKVQEVVSPKEVILFRRNAEAY